MTESFYNVTFNYYDPEEDKRSRAEELRKCATLGHNYGPDGENGETPWVCYRCGDQRGTA